MTIGETLADPDRPVALPAITVDQPSLAMTIGLMVMIFSFRTSVDAWIQHGIVADLFIAPASNEVIGLEAAVPPAAGSGEPFDPAKLDQLCQELERAGVVEMVNDFLNELPSRLAEIQRLNAEELWAELERATHSLKGLCALFGLPTLAETFLALEDAAEAGEAKKIKPLLANLPALVEAGSGQLRRWLENQKPPPVV